MRLEPFTPIGLKRMKCAKVGCNERAYAQWQICSDGNQYRPVCRVHDVEMNQMVMNFFFGETDISEYRKKVLG